MYKQRFFKKVSLWVLLFAQIFLLTSYFYFQRKPSNVSEVPTASVSFIGKLTTTKANKNTYHTISDKITLQLLNTRNSYVDFNTSLCFINGTDIRAMQRTKDLNWTCKCKPNWHGTDCGQPEVVWRALLAYRHATVTKRPRKYQRRIIYLFEITQFSEAITDIRLNELMDIVDLFVLCDSDETGKIKKKLGNGFFEPHQDKILYLHGFHIKESLLNLKHVITNLQDDDIILYNEDNIIPNKLALIFFKYYDEWPQPLNFRLRWSVYGFFWIHPLKTTVQGFASTVGYMYETFNDNLSLLHGSNKSFTLGDLNHYGGWFCEFCNDANEIIAFLKSKQTKSSVISDIIKQRTVDSNFVEDAIETGVYLDGRTELVRGHRFNENYFAPTFVCDNSWKYDYLLVNMYSKLDYYQ